MFGSELKPFSRAKIIKGMSRTLGVINEVIPIYKEAKPMINNARNVFNIVKEFGTNSVNKIITNKDKNMAPIKEKINTIQNVNFTKVNKPTFFQ